MKILVLILIGSLFNYLPINLCRADAVPFISFQDLKALYPQGKSVFNLDWPTANDLPNKEGLIKQCKADFSEYYRSILSKQIPNTVKSKIVLFRVSRDPDNSIIYLIFEVDPEHANDLMVVYFVNSKTNRLILKMRL